MGIDMPTYGENAESRAESPGWGSEEFQYLEVG